MSYTPTERMKTDESNLSGNEVTKKRNHLQTERKRLYHSIRSTLQQIIFHQCQHYEAGMGRSQTIRLQQSGFSSYRRLKQKPSYRVSFDTRYENKG